MRKHTSENRPLIVSFSLLYILFFDALLKEDAGYQRIRQKNTCKGHLFEKSRGRPCFQTIHNQTLLGSENFSKFAKFAFSEQTSFTQKNEANLCKERFHCVFPGFTLSFGRFRRFRIGFQGKTIRKHRSILIRHSNILDLQSHFFMLFYPY